MSEATPASDGILFFDGVCGLCDRSVTFLFLRDRRHALRFAPLQGETAARLLAPDQRESLRSMVFLDHGRALEGSTAVLKAMTRLGGVWRLARLLTVVPRPIRDAVYGVVAQHRYRWFGKADACRLPTPAERPYFLP